MSCVPEDPRPGLVTWLTLHSPCPHSLALVSQPKILPLAFVSSHIPAQLPLVARWEGCSGETRQET